METPIPTHYPPWKTLLVLVVISAGTSAALYIPIVQLTESLGYDPRAGVLFFGAALIALHAWLFYGVANALVKINVAMAQLNNNQTPQEIPANCSTLLRPMIEQTNQLIRERASLKTMRGQLVEQISEAAAQEERNRLARDLHDSIKQQVFSMSVSAAAAHAHLDSNPTAARAALLDVKTSAQEAMVEMRALLQQLSPAPLEKSGLIQALRDQCEALAYRTGATVTPKFSLLPPDDRLPTGAQEALFRIAQEALSNIARHARAQHVTLSLDYTDGQPLVLRVQDDGQGFDPAQAVAGMGLGNIHSRAQAIGAAVDLTSAPGGGTTLAVSVPLVVPEEDDNGDSAQQAEYEERLKPIISLYYQFAGAVAAFIVAGNMIGWRLTHRADRFADDALLVIILIVMVVIGLGAIPYGWWARTKAQRLSDDLTASAGKDSRIDLKRRRHLHMAYLIIGLSAAWFYPMPHIYDDEARLQPLLVAAVFMAGVVWHYLQMRQLYRRELLKMPTAARTPELDLRLRELRGSWPSIGFLMVVTVLSATISGEVRFPPQDTDHWMNTAFIGFSILLVVNQLVSIATYRRWKAELV